MTPATLDDMARVLPTLDRGQFSNLVYGVLGYRPDQTEYRASSVPPVDRLLMGVWEFLMATGTGEIPSRALLFELKPALERIAPLLAEPAAALPAFRLTIAEQRWATWPAAGRWLDLSTMADVGGLAEPPVLLVTCDVTALHLRLGRRLANLRSGTDARPQHHAGPGRDGREGPHPGGPDVGGHVRHDDAPAGG